MEYLKGSYSTSNTQATLLAPPPITCDVTVIVTGIVTGKPTLIFFSSPNPILGTQTFWRADKTEKPKNRKNEKPKTQ